MGIKIGRCSIIGKYSEEILNSEIIAEGKKGYTIRITPKKHDKIIVDGEECIIISIIR